MILQRLINYGNSIVSFGNLNMGLTAPRVVRNDSQRLISDGDSIVPAGDLNSGLTASRVVGIDSQV